MRRAFASDRRIACGDILDSISLKMSLRLLGFLRMRQLPQIPVEQLVRQRQHLIIEPFAARLVPADQEHGAPVRVESKQDAKWPALALDTQLFHVRVLASLEGIDERATESRPDLAKHEQGCANI